MNPDEDLALIKVAEHGDGVALIISRDSAARMGVRIGDLMQASKSGGVLSIKPCDPVVKRQLEIAQQVMEERRDVLRRLAE